MASYTKLGHENWQARIRVRGHKPMSESGFRTKKDADDWADPIETKMREKSRMRGDGPHKTNLAVAMREYAFAVTAYQAGCVQAICKINKYLVAGGLKPLKATQLQGGRVFGRDEDGNLSADKQTVQEPLFKLEEFEPVAVYKNAQQRAFAKRDGSNTERHEQVQPLREAIARMPVSKLAPHRFKDIMRAMQTAGYGSATIRQELAILSGFFTVAKREWSWPLVENPLLQFDWPVPSGRERVASERELERIAAALSHSQNKVFVRFVLFALETAMRKGETISTACWCDVDRDSKVLRLPVAKAGRREVPLSPTALLMLEEMPQGLPTDRIFSIEAGELDSCWKRLCERAKITNLHIHDLRHTSATMYAELLKGDIFALQKITGHKTFKALQMYVNLSAKKVSQKLAELNESTIVQKMREQETSLTKAFTPGKADGGNASRELSEQTQSAAALGKPVKAESSENLSIHLVQGNVVNITEALNKRLRERQAAVSSGSRAEPMAR